jgi:hypothetical protein
MHSDLAETDYYERRLQSALVMAANAVHPGAALAHQGLAACYRGKLMSMRQATTPRVILSLSAFREKKEARALEVGRPARATEAMAARF